MVHLGSTYLIGTTGEIDMEIIASHRDRHTSYRLIAIVAAALWFITFRSWSVEVDPYFPLQPGNFWIYDSGNKKTVQNQTVEINGVATKAIEDSNGSIEYFIPTTRMASATTVP